MSHPDDEARLIQRAIAGDGSAIGALLAAHEPELLAYLRKRARDMLGSRESASDVLQESLLLASQSIDQLEFRSALELRGWLYTLAERKLVERVRFHRRARRDLGRERALDDSGQAGSALAGLALRAVVGAEPQRDADLADMERALARLAGADREILSMAYVDGMSSRQVAAALGINEGAARKRKLRARARLAALFGDISGGASRS